MIKHTGPRAALLGLALLASSVALAQTTAESRPSAQSNVHPETSAQASGDATCEGGLATSSTPDRSAA